MLNFLYQTMSHLWFWTSSIFNYFLYLQPNRGFFKQPYFNKIIR